MIIETIFYSIVKPFIFHIASILLLVLIFNLAYGIICHFLKNKETKKIQFIRNIIIFIAIIFGLYFRISLAWFSPGNFDIQSYNIVSDLVSTGKNVYANTARYNYSPLWFYLLFFLKKTANLTSLSFPFIVRFFLTMVDLATLFMLFKISKLKKMNFSRIAVAFFLNPISILLTGHHGQFENFTILLILIGIYIYLKSNNNKIALFMILLGGILKHNIFNLVISSINYIFKRKILVIFISVLSIIIFLGTFMPYWNEGKINIIENVFLYKSYEGFYGINAFIKKIGPIAKFTEFYRCLFILGYFLFAFFFKAKDLTKTILLNILFFLTFTSAMADQYYILPIALGALIGGKIFYIYTFIVSLFLFKSSAQLNQQQYSFITDVWVWLTITLWFIILCFKDGKKTYLYNYFRRKK